MAGIAEVLTRNQKALLRKRVDELFDPEWWAKSVNEPPETPPKAVALSNFTVAVLDAAIGFEAKQKACRDLFRDAAQQAAYAYVETGLNIAFFQFEDTSLLTMYGETNHWFVASKFAPQTQKAITEWLAGQGVNIEPYW